ncbi:MAG: hypothetical protein GXO85_04890 [Chlorobi bacterium]|nr:hypothetical protein [Chlorobiota bacterium]
MKKYIFLVLFVSGVVFGQNVQVISNEPVTKIEQGKFFYPQVSPTGESIIFSSENYDGIWQYNTANGKIEKIIDAPGAGYEPKFSLDGTQIIYREDQFINKLKYSSIHEFDLKSKTDEILQTKARNVTPPLERPREAVAYVVNKNLVIKNISNKLRKTDFSNERIVTIENTQMIVYQNGKRKVYAPLEDGSYLWPSVSPDETKLLFTVAGVGTFVTDFDGNIISEIGYAHYPKWSKDGKWIVYMEDYDDGYKVTSSELHVVSVDGTVDVELTDTPNINEMYPSWSPVANEIVYNTTDGVIYKLKLKID